MDAAPTPAPASASRVPPANEAELKAAVNEFARDRSRAMRETTAVAFAGAVSGFLVGRTAGDAFVPARVPDAGSAAGPSPSSHYRIPRVVGSRPFRVTASNGLGVALSLVGGGVVAAYAARERGLHEAFDPSFLAEEYGAPQDLVDFLSGAKKRRALAEGAAGARGWVAGLWGRGGTGSGRGVEDEGAARGGPSAEDAADASRGRKAAGGSG